MNNTLPTFTQEEINKAKSDTWDFLFLFLDAYYQIMASDANEQSMQAFSAAQHTLMAFNSLYGEVSNGGFLQLIQNGYGSYIFDNPFSAHIKEWGAVEIAKIVDEAKLIYEQHKDDLEKETSLEEFSAMYNEYTSFEPLDDKFYEVMDTELEIIKTYVEQNINSFANIK